MSKTKSCGSLVSARWADRSLASTAATAPSIRLVEFLSGFDSRASLASSRITQLATCWASCRSPFVRDRTVHHSLVEPDRGRCHPRRALRVFQNRQPFGGQDLQRPGPSVWVGDHLAHLPAPAGFSDLVLHLGDGHLTAV